MPPSARSKRPLVIARCAGERADLVTEQFGFEQRVADRGAVHLENCGVPAVGQVVQARRDEFLAGAAFADDQHGFFERRDLRDVVEHLQECRRLAQQAFGFSIHVGDSANSW